jgi:arylsulfatase A
MEGGADPEFFNSSAGLRGVKRDLYEGGVRVPFIVSWPGTVKADRTSDHISAFWDVLPTVGELGGFKPDKTDGLSFLPELLGREQVKHDFFYWEFHEMGGKQAILKDEWKAVRLHVKENPNGPLELYKLETDPREQKNVADQHPDLVQTFSRMMEEEREVSKNFNFGITTLSGE